MSRVVVSRVAVVRVGVAFLLQLGDTGRQGPGVELALEGTLYPFDVAAGLGVLGRQDEELNAVLLADFSLSSQGECSGEMQE